MALACGGGTEECEGEETNGYFQSQRDVKPASGGNGRAPRPALRSNSAAGTHFLLKHLDKGVPDDLALRLGLRDAFQAGQEQFCSNQRGRGDRV